MMFDDYRNQLAKWNKSTSDRQKLQFVYLVVIVVTFFAASIVSLLNQRVGMFILKITVLAIVVFSINAVAWSLLQTSLLSKLNEPASRRKSNK